MSTTTPAPLGSYLTPSFAHARVADAMRPRILACHPGDALRDIARLMATEHVHAVVVLGERVEPSGSVAEGAWAMVTDLELLRCADRVDDLTSGDAARTDLVTVQPDERLPDAAEHMIERGVTHAVVVAPSDGRPVGMLSTLDIAGIVGWGLGWGATPVAGRLDLDLYNVLLGFGWVRERAELVRATLDPGAEQTRAGMHRDVMLGRDAGLPVAEHDDDLIARAARDRGQAARSRLVADDGQRRMIAHERRRDARVGRPLQHRLQGLGLRLTGGEDDDLAGVAHGPQPHGQRLARDRLRAAEVRRVRLDRRGMERDAVDAAAGRRAGLVEREMPVAPDPEHREVDRMAVEQPLVATRLRGRLGGGPVEPLPASDRDAGELPVDGGGEAPLVVMTQTDVLVELEHRGLIGGSAPARA